MMKCDRCGSSVYKYEHCDYCKRKICVNCVKSSRRVSKTKRVVICKDCWSKLPKRAAFKTATRAS